MNMRSLYSSTRSRSLSPWWPSMCRSFLLFPFALALLTACSPAADMTAAEAAVPGFHALLNAGRFDEIYASSSSDMKAATTQQDFVAFLEAVQKKLGSTTSTTLQTWHINYNSSGNFATLVYNTTFAGGLATEQFVFRMKDKTATLAGYNINSTVLVLK